MRPKLSREELFELVWAAPSSSLAKELGISDVALGKLCLREQVPKPPPGYWAKVRAGRSPRRPRLPEFHPERRPPRPVDMPGTHLSPGKLRYFHLALERLGDAADLGELRVDGTRILSLPAELASSLILTLESVLRSGDVDDHSWQREHAHRKVIAELVDTLLPFAESTLLVLAHKRSYGDPDLCLVRLNAETKRSIAQLRRIVIENNLDFVCRGLDGNSISWRKSGYDPDLRAYRIFVSTNHVWVRAIDSEDKVVAETERVDLSTVLPIESFAELDFRVPSVIAPSRDRLDAGRIGRYLKSKNLLDESMDASCRLGQLNEDPSNICSLRSALSDTEIDQVRAASELARIAEARLDNWEADLGRECTSIVEDFLGVRLGDRVCLTEESQRQLTLQLTSVDLWSKDEELVFWLTGTRYRKDGSLGKRVESRLVRARLSSTERHQIQRAREIGFRVR